MEMTPGEIVRSYLGAADRRKQIQILAELNATNKEYIKKILRDQNITLPDFRKKEIAPVQEEAPKKIKVPAIVYQSIQTQIATMEDTIKNVSFNLEKLKHEKNELEEWLNAVECEQ